MRRIVFVCAIFTSLFASEVYAGRPGWIFPVQGQQRIYRQAAAQHSYPTRYVQRAAPSYRETYQYLHARYPKYIGGFHANYFRDLGVPPGDVGIRGNGLYAFPW